MKRLLFALLFLMPLAARPGEKPPVHLTGNRQVDFFGGAQPALALSDRPVSFQEFSSSAGGSEKSPWIAGALSLAIPGAGEIYTKNYVKGAVFFAVEAASWIVAYSYDKKGNDQTTLFKAYANEHYSADRYTRWTIAHLSALNPVIPKSPQDYKDAIYVDIDPDTDPLCAVPFDCINWAELNAMERDIAAGGGNGYTHSLPYYGEQQYFELIGKYEQFSRGWDDSDPASPVENNVPIRSTSARMFQYAEMRAQANNYYDVASTFVSVAVINHILSAADAFWSATRYNKALHAELRMKMQRTPYGYTPLTQANFRFDF
jgi:hypothetical protein